MKVVWLILPILGIVFGLLAFLKHEENRIDDYNNVYIDSCSKYNDSILFYNERLFEATYLLSKNLVSDKLTLETNIINYAAHISELSKTKQYYFDLMIEYDYNYHKNLK